MGVQVPQEMVSLYRLYAFYLTVERYSIRKVKIKSKMEKTNKKLIMNIIKPRIQIIQEYMCVCVCLGSRESV